MARLQNPKIRRNKDDDDDITPALISLHCLRVPERIFFKLAVLTYRPIHCTSPSYLQSCFTRVADMTSRRRLRSSASHRLEVTCHPFDSLQPACGRSQLPANGANMCNDLPLHLTSSQLLAVSDSVSRFSSFLVPTRTFLYDSLIRPIIYIIMDARSA